MAVYVDPPFRWPIDETKGAAKLVAKRTGGWWSHMIADTEEELHEMAQKIGMQRSWFQNKSTPHYDLTPKRRLHAIREGAVELERREFVYTLRSIRESSKD